MFQVCVRLSASLFYRIRRAVAESNLQNKYEWTYVVRVKLREGEKTIPMNGFDYIMQISDEIF